MTVRQTIFAGAVAALILAPGAAGAQSSKLLGKFDAWTAYSHAAKAGKLCYVRSDPVASAPKNVKRGPIVVFVTTRPKGGVHEEVSIAIGYPFKPGAAASAEIGPDKFGLFTKGERAWVKGKDADKAFVAAMKRGKELIVKGVSKRGTKTTDKYSLKGITAALAEMATACK